MGKYIQYLDISLERLKGVLIDIDNTLYEYEPAHNKALNNAYNDFISKFPGMSYHDFSSIYTSKRKEVTKRLAKQGSCRSRFFAFQAMLEETGYKQAYQAALFFENLYWSSFIDSIELLEEARFFLQKCKSQKISVCAVSDMQARFQVQKLQKLDVVNFIDFLVTSEEVGVEKPSPIIFQRALTKMGLTSQDVIMIGDSEEKDGLGAKSLNIKFYRVGAF